MDYVVAGVAALFLFGYLIYALLNLELWVQTFIDRPGEEVERATAMGTVDDPRRAVLVAHRLVPCPEVDDAQPAHPQADAWGQVHALGVRSAVPKRPAHRADLRLVDRAACQGDDSGDAAHDSAPSHFPAPGRP